MMTSGRSSSRYPFTASQWQELEHQALIFKYMASGHPIPSDLILHIRRSFLLDSITTTSPTLSYPPHPTIGWSCYHQMGFGRKAEDPEPGRCRRTDGKKWRCSKEAYPDSKYCERHMHRGKNRSRKPVEMSLTTAAAAAAPSSSQTPPLSLSSQPAETNYHLMYPYSSYRPPGALGFHPLQNNTSHFNLDNTASYSSDDHKDYRYCNGVKDADEYTFFSGGSGAERGSSWEFRPLGMNSLGERKQGNALQQQQGSYSFSSKEGEEKQPHCFVLGADFKLEKPVKEERATEEEAQRPLRHFFDEWPQKSKDSWMDLEDGHSKTQLSISIPMAHHDFMVSGSRYRNDD